MSTPKAVTDALTHVRAHHPDITTVMFGIDARWRYMNDDLEAPKFGDEIDTGVLEDAADSLGELPAIFRLDVPHH